MRVRRLGFFLLILALLSFTLSLIILSRPSSTPTEDEHPPIRIKIDPEISGELGPLIEEFLGTSPDVDVNYSDYLEEEDCNTTIDAHPSLEGFQCEIFQLPGVVLRAGSIERVLTPPKNYWLASEYSSEEVAALAKYLQESYAREHPPFTMNVLGDIIPGRHVAEKMARQGILYPFTNIAPYVNEADLIYADLECPLSDRYKPPYSGTDFIAPSKTIEGLLHLGIDVVALANNHSTNFGTQPFLDTLSLLEANQIKYVGGGRNSQEAYAPLFMEVKGTKIAFLDYNSILGSINATDTRPGVAWIDMLPFSQDDPADIRMVQEAVRKARGQADLVIVSFHWSEEYKYYPSPSQKNMAHAACDAGATLVIGSHPHCIQSIEFYQGHLIAYSLGNFIFDQMWADYTREGFIAKLKFQGRHLAEITLIPYKIYDYCQPNVFPGNSGQYLVDKLFQISGL